MMLYATWVEHWVNGVIAGGLLRHGFNHQDCRQVIREANLNAKTGWLWRLLFGGAFPEDLRAQVNDLAQARNAFVHYKWQPVDADRDDIDVRVQVLNEVAPSLVAALADLGQRQFYVEPEAEDALIEDAVNLIFPNRDT